MQGRKKKKEGKVKKKKKKMMTKKNKKKEKIETKMKKSRRRRRRKLRRHMLSCIKGYKCVTMMFCVGNSKEYSRVEVPFILDLLVLNEGKILS